MKRTAQQQQLRTDQELKLKKKFVETSFDIILPDCLEGQNPDFKTRRICGAPFHYYYHKRLLYRIHPRYDTVKEICGNLFL